MNITCKPYIPINPKGDPLTIEKLRTFKGFEHYSDEQAKDTVDSISTLAEILIRTTSSKTTNNANQQVLYLEQSLLEQNKAA